MYVTYKVSHLVSRQKLRKIHALCLPFHSHVPCQVLFNSFFSVQMPHKFLAEVLLQVGEKLSLKDMIFLHYSVQKNSAFPCAACKALEFLQSALWEEQGLAVLVQQVPSVAKWWLSCKRRVTAFVTLHASNNGAMSFEQRKYISQRGTHAVFRAIEDGNLQIFGFGGARVCSSGCSLVPQPPSQGRLMNKQFNNAVGVNFPGVP